MFGNRSGEPPDDLLDCRLFRWPSGDHYTYRDLFDGGLLCLGRTGSGKTSSVLRHVASSLIRHPRTGGYILAASPGDERQWRKLFADAGMTNKLIVFDERGPFRFNAIDFILQNGGRTRDVVKALVNMSEILSKAGGQEGERFFVQNEYRLLWSAVEVVKQATGKVDPATLLAFINAAAQSQEQLLSESWEKESPHARCLAEARLKPKTANEANDYLLAETYWLEEFPPMASKTRSGILAGVQNTLFTFNTGYVRDLIGTTSNVSPRAMDSGYWVLVNTPIARLGEEGALILGIWKYLSQWHTTRRNPDRDNPPLVGIVDEMQNTLSSMDAQFLAECRKYHGALIGLSQGLSSFLANMDGEKAKARVHALMTNFSHKVLLALGDLESMEWASSLVGKEWKTTTGGSEKPDPDEMGSVFGSEGYQASFNETLLPVLEPTEFSHNLRTGGVRNGYTCDSIVIRSGEAFANGRNWQRVAWSQR